MEKNSLEEALEDMVKRLEIKDKDREYVRLMLLGSYHLGRESIIKAFKSLLEIK